jgi:hypothetical protein
LSLPFLIFLGLPSATANGTNRLGILLPCWPTWASGSTAVSSRPGRA